MKKFSILFILVTILFASCSSDSKTEKKLVGEWESEGSERIEGFEFKYTTTLCFSDDKTFRVEEYCVSPDIPELYYSVRYEGTWKATSEEIFTTIDEKSIEFTCSDEFDKSEREEFENDILSELKKSGFETSNEIITLNQTTLVIYDEKERVKYSRKEDLEREKSENDKLSALAKKKNTPVVKKESELRKLKLECFGDGPEPLSPQAGNTYYGKNLVDGNTSTAWAIDLNKQESIGNIWGPTIGLVTPAKVDHIVIYNGYAKNATSFKNNSRPAWITLYRPIAPDTGEPEDKDILYEGPLSDTSSPQRLNINPKFDNSEPVKEICLKFAPRTERSKYYFGDKWPKDLLISEIEIWGN